MNNGTFVFGEEQAILIKEMTDIFSSSTTKGRSSDAAKSWQLLQEHTIHIFTPTQALMELYMDKRMDRYIDNESG